MEYDDGNVDQSCRWGEREEGRERNPMDMVRGAHMDGDRSAPNDRSFPRGQEGHPEIGRSGRDGAGGNSWGDRRLREQTEGKRGETVRGRNETFDGREEDGVRKGHDRAERPRDDSRSARGREEVRDRQGQGSSRREDKREPRESRRRSRSREREGERSKDRRRERSKDREPSPYTKALESWRKFKQAEKVVLDQVPFFIHAFLTEFSQVANRREIFDKRPEDHPAYGEEWRTFWEKRLEGFGSHVVCLYLFLLQVQRTAGPRKRCS